jgi:23S rRNA (cytosine1962-C5)-methyltransferase
MPAPARLPDVTVKSRGARRIASRHPWVFADDVASAGAAAHGDVVRVRETSGRALGTAFWSGTSKISLRMLSTGDAEPGPAFWAARVEAAGLRRGATVAAWEAKRVLFGESDGIPGLVADLYGAHLVVQVLTAGAERVLPDVLAALHARYRIDSVLARNDVSVRTLEGLPRETAVLEGDPPTAIAIDEGGVRLTIDPRHGQKTGAFLDQRENRVACQPLARGRVLDVFSFHASFGLHAARGADEVVVVDSSGDALARGRAHADVNGFDNMTFVEANAFDDLRLRQRRGERFELVMLDPPAFAKSRGDIAAARRGYKEVNLRAIRLLSPGGILVTSSCSYNLDEPSFEDILREAAADAGRDLVVVARRGQAADHPVRLGFPESRYLKCFVVQDAAVAS